MQKEVRFDIYCKSCQFYHASASNDPCNECLGKPDNGDSHVPVLFKKAGALINFLLPDPVVTCYTRDPLQSANWREHLPSDADLKQYFKKDENGDWWEKKED